MAQNYSPVNRPGLNPRHLEELHASGLTDETIEAAGIYSVGKNGDAERLLGWKQHHCDWGAGWVAPFNLPDEPDPSYHQVKFDFPRHGENGKAIKYESPLGKMARAYFPAGFRNQLKSSRVVVITEGVKKSLALTQAHFCTIGLVGVWMFQQRRMKTDTGRSYGARQLIPDLTAIDWSKLTVVIVYDSDAETNAGVRLAECKLAELLTARGATVRMARLPADGNCKVGADDYLMKHGVDAMRQVIDDAEEAEEPPKLEEMDWAKLYLEDQRTRSGSLALRWHREVFYEWDGRRYIAIPDTDLRGSVLRWVDARGGPAKPRYVGEVVKCLASLCRVPHDVETPALLLQHDRATHPNLLAMHNGILDLNDVLAGRPVKLRKHTPLWFSTMALPYIYDCDAKAPVWHETLREILGDDEESANLLAEWFGYCLTLDTKYQSILLLNGPPRTGKGTILRAMRLVIGADNTCEPRLMSLAETFGLQGLLNKRLAICPDAHLGHGDKAIGVLETLKSISGEDAVMVNRKHLSPINTRLRIRFALAANELPKFGDGANTLSSRLLLIPCRNSFLGREDRTLEERITSEASGIFNWSIEGLRRLENQKGFTRPEASKSILADFERLVSPLTAFIEDCCAIDSILTVSRNDLWSAWKSWCEKPGHQPGSRELMGTRLSSLVPNLTHERPRIDGGRPWTYRGVGLRSAVTDGQGLGGVEEEATWTG